MKSTHRIKQSGFSLVEVLVTMLIMAVGLLGLAKLQAASISNTQVSRVRSLVALHAGGLAAVMQANRNYWSTAGAVGNIAVGANGAIDYNVVPAPIAYDVAAAPVTGNCAIGPCTPAQMAAYDLAVWAAQLNGRFPGSTANVVCTAPAVGRQTSCNITVTWNERYVAINNSTAASATTLVGTEQYTLYVEP